MPNLSKEMTSISFWKTVTIERIQNQKILRTYRWIPGQQVTLC